ncbi:DUF1090 domain-containing protein [Halomonas sp.]|uniref:DUF1090 domain-containing protein n=1 Tax=Halomonas sp. TaxID=1486246 RepID=UPI003F91FD93
MKKNMIQAGVVALLAGMLLPPVAAAADDLCESKAADVREQLAHAQAQGNQHREEGLQRALDAIDDNCTNESVLNDATDEVKESLAEVQERQSEFEEALNEGDDDDIEKRRVKLEEATLELERHTEELNALQQQISE